ncbi:S-methyl-5-thioribose-1-phosphate isomerase [Halorutilales archaeon Cl-col2-1]
MRTIDWNDERDCVKMVDQTQLPGKYTEYYAETVDELVESIEILRVRGAPALGAAGGFGVALSATRREGEDRDIEGFKRKVRNDAGRISDARPTAVNLSKGVDKVLKVVEDADSVEDAVENAVDVSKRIADDDIETNKQIGRNGAELLDDGDTVMTHCNAGALATVDWGTALGVVYSAHDEGKEVDVIANETRPLNQGSRITTVELEERGVGVCLIPDNASGLAIQEGRVDAVVVGADRITARGDTTVFNKIGTYKHAVIADRHDVPFYVAAPTSTIDTETDAEDVEIEKRNPDELRYIYGTQNAPEDVDVYNPAFDRTPGELVDAVVTEDGVFEPSEIEEYIHTTSTPY